MQNVRKFQKIFGVASFIAGAIIVPIAFFPINIVLIVIGGYFLVNGIFNLVIEI
jgi:uncharacterized membrane protein HdeD (DUF308 family)